MGLSGFSRVFRSRLLRNRAQRGAWFGEYGETLGLGDRGESFIHQDAIDAENAVDA